MTPSETQARSDFAAGRKDALAYETNEMYRRWWQQARREAGDPPAAAEPRKQAENEPELAKSPETVCPPGDGKAEEPAPEAPARARVEVPAPQALADRPEARPASGKPPYRVPLMAEIAARPRNGFKVVSTFSGCGGSSLGYKMAGFEVLWANEFIPAAQETYVMNHPGTILDRRDIRTVQAQDILDATGLKVGEIDLFDGSPPCASFSTAGIREDGWGREKKYSDTKQRTDDLFFEYARLIKGTQPKVFVAENVAGLTVGVAKEMLGEGQMDAFETQEDTILHTLMDCGYRVGFHVLNAVELGVPQSRRRVIFVGIRKDLAAAHDLEPRWPRPLSHRYVIRDALLDPIPAEFDVPGADIERYAIGREWENLKAGEQSEKYFSLIKTSADEACPCICASHGASGIASITHFEEKRKFSIGELRRLGGFPDDFKLTGTYEQQWERIGRAVPPLMMEAVAATIRDEILSKIPKLEVVLPEIKKPQAAFVPENSPEPELVTTVILPSRSGTVVEGDGQLSLF